MLTDLWPTTDVQFTSDEHAAILAGLVVKNTAGVPRAGIFPTHGGALVTARPDMRVNVLPQAGVHVKEGARFFALTEQIDLAVPNPPAANTQYSIVCYVGTDKKLTGTASTSDFVVVPGSPSATPSDPALPDAAIPIARVSVPSTATATNSAGVVITPLYPMTAAAGGSVGFRTLAQLTAWTTATVGQSATVFADSSSSNGAYRFDGASWVSVARSVSTYTWSAGGVGDNGVVSSSVPMTRLVAESPGDSFVLSKAGLSVTVTAGLYTVSLVASVGVTPVTGRSFAQISKGSTLVSRNNAQAGEDTFSTTAVVYVESDGTVVSGSLFKATGGLSNMSGRFTIAKIG